MFSNFSRGWDSLSTNQKMMVIIVGALVLYGIASSGGQGMFGNLLNPGRLIALALIVFVALPVHEYAHAAMAVRLGDPTPRLQGRLTLNPIPHIDPVGAILIFFAGFGWAKPVQWNPRNIEGDIKTASILIAIVGPLSNLLMAIIALIFSTNFSDGMLAGTFGFFVYINVLLFVFNMIPVPPLDGSHILFALWPGDTYMLRAQLSQFGMLVIFAVIFFIPTIITGPTEFIISLMARLVY